MQEAGTAPFATWSDASMLSTLEHHPVSETLRFALDEAPTEEDLAATIDESAFVLGEQVGRGGFADVFLATQPALERTVAIKRVRSLERLSAVRRFLHEACITARLNHHNILPIHDLVVVEGHPALVMKYVKGESWAAHLERVRSTGTQQLWTEVARLLHVARAVAFAHRHGVLHLDLKPSNVMLGEADETLVMDWGCAALVDEEGWDPDTRPLLARELSTPRGTPVYMAPELAAGRGDAISPATDVYLLGAILFELLTGRHLRQGVSTWQVLAEACSGALPELSPHLNPTLRALCLEALAPDPAARLPTVEAFVDRLQAWLDTRESRALTERALARLGALSGLRVRTPEHRRELVGLLGVFEQAGRRGSGLQSAVQAEWDTRRLLAWDALRQGEPGLAREFALPLPDDAPVRAQLLERVAVAGETRRRAMRSALLLRVVLFLALVGGIGALAAVLSSQRAANQERERFQAQMEFTAELLHSVGVAEDLGFDPGLVLKVLSDTEDRIQTQYADQPVPQAELWTSMGTAYLALDEPARGLQYLWRAYRLLERSQGSNDPATLESMETLAGALNHHDRVEEADRLLATLLSRHASSVGPGADETIGARSRVAALRRSWGRYDEAAALERQNFDLLLAAVGPEHEDTLSSEHHLCWILRDADQLDEARAHCQHSHEGRLRLLGPEHPDTSASAHNLALLYGAAGQYVEAVDLIGPIVAQREVQNGFEHIKTLHAAQNLGLYLREAGRYTESVELLQRVLPQMIRLQGPNGIGTQTTQNNLGLAWMHLEQYDTAEGFLRASYESRSHELGIDAPRTIYSAVFLGELLLKQGALDESHHILTSANQSAQAVFGPSSANTLNVQMLLAQVQAARGETEAARALALETFNASEQLRGPDDAETRRCLEGLADVYLRTGDRSAAQARFEALFAAQTKALGAAHPATLRTLSRLLDNLRALQQVSVARALRRDHRGAVAVALGEQAPWPEQQMWLERIDRAAR